jgi:hypothetical protein
MPRLVSQIGWFAVAVLGAIALGVVALRRGEAINALWIVSLPWRSTWLPTATTACSSPPR